MARYYERVASSTAPHTTPAARRAAARGPQRAAEARAGRLTIAARLRLKTEASPFSRAGPAGRLKGVGNEDGGQTRAIAMAHKEFDETLQLLRPHPST